MNQLDFDQRAIIDSPKGARKVIAGPGSGKTTAMVALVDSLRAGGVRDSDIRCVTFSKEAANTIEKRSGLKGIFSTFHSLGYQICSEVERKPVEPELRHRLMYRLTRKWSLDYKVLDGFISRMRRENISPEQATKSGEYSHNASAAYAEYEHVRAAQGWVDFDSMICDAVRLLETSAGVRARWQPMYLIVDEAQDTDGAQQRLMQLMTERHGNITVVGDPCQAIYGFRGAQPQNLIDFEKWFPTSTSFYLGRNYRSTRNIVRFIKDNAPPGTPRELLNRMEAVRTDEGRPVGMKMYWTDDDEAEAALALAQADPTHSIILTRTNRMVGLLERLCNRHSIRYHLMGRSGFWKQNEIRKAIEELKKYPSLSMDAAFSMALPSLESKYAVNDRTDRDNDALENLKVFRLIGKDFQTAKEFVVYANKMIHRRNDPRGVSISTVHQAKGGEWRNVFVVGAKAGGFPHKKGDPDEEARIYFVAISRAMDYLRISFAGTPSPYLRKYLTDEILDRLREKAAEVEHLQAQQKLFDRR